jgi:hypothetical protein
VVIIAFATVFTVCTAKLLHYKYHRESIERASGERTPHDVIIDFQQRVSKAWAKSILL